jgi:hypothetical protein
MRFKFISMWKNYPYIINWFNICITTGSKGWFLFNIVILGFGIAIEKREGDDNI